MAILSVGVKREASRPPSLPSANRLKASRASTSRWFSERLGHAGTTITRDTYQHVTPVMDAAVASLLADLVDGGGA